MAIANKIEFHFRANSDKKIAIFFNKLKNPTLSPFIYFFIFLFLFLFILWGGGGLFKRSLTL